MAGLSWTLFRLTVSHSIKGLKSKIIKVLACWTLVTAMLAVGGAVMSRLEGPELDRINDAQLKTIDSVRKRLFDLGITDVQWGVIQKELAEAGVCNWQPKQGWDFISGAFFTMTMITTIGYGSRAPITDSGRVFSVVWGMIGVLLMALTLSRVGILLYAVINTIRRFIYITVGWDPLDAQGHFSPHELHRVQAYFDEKKDAHGLMTAETIRPALSHLHAPIRMTDGEVDQIVEPKLAGNSGMNWETFKEVAEAYYQKALIDAPPLYVTQLVVGGVLLLMFFLAGGPVFSTVEGWRYRDGWWFCILTVMTIGLGDYAPTTQFGMILGIAFAFSTLGVLSYCVNVVSRMFFFQVQRATKLFLQRTQDYRDAHGNLMTTELALSVLSPTVAAKRRQTVMWDSRENGADGNQPRKSSLPPRGPNRTDGQEDLDEPLLENDHRAEQDKM